jgi:2-amino-4-hydroxy-6-hydroxymethyldihydropteridine diphosphokinase
LAAKISSDYFGRLQVMAALSIYIGLGTNLGDRESNLAEARRRIGRLHLKLAGSRIERVPVAIRSVSSIYETEPVGFRDQPWFLNQVVEARASVAAIPGSEITIKARELLEDLLEIESDMGRERVFLNGPRAIDIDLLMIDRLVIRPASPEDLSLPHPRMHLRRFVLEPLCEIAPGAVHPVTGKTSRQLLAEVRDSSEIRLFKPVTGDVDEP